jgi:hypothetical protein
LEVGRVCETPRGCVAARDRCRRAGIPRDQLGRRKPTSSGRARRPRRCSERHRVRLGRPAFPGEDLVEVPDHGVAAGGPSQRSGSARTSCGAGWCSATCRRGAGRPLRRRRGRPLLPFPALQPKCAILRFDSANAAPPCMSATAWSTLGASGVRGAASQATRRPQSEHGAFCARAVAITRARTSSHFRDARGSVTPPALRGKSFPRGEKKCPSAGSSDRAFGEPTPAVFCEQWSCRHLLPTGYPGLTRRSRWPL